MGFRFSRRIGKTTGLNISKSGISASIRTRIGSFGTRGFDFRTGIKGLTWRGTWFSGHIFHARSWFSLPGLLNLLISLVFFVIKVGIIVVVVAGLIVVEMFKLVFRLIARLRGKTVAENPPANAGAAADDGGQKPN